MISWFALLSNTAILSPRFTGLPSATSHFLNLYFSSALKSSADKGTFLCDEYTTGSYTPRVAKASQNSTAPRTSTAGCTLLLKISVIDFAGIMNDLETEFPLASLTTTECSIPSIKPTDFLESNAVFILLHLYWYGGCPPLTSTLAIPLFISEEGFRSSRCTDMFP